MSQEKSQITKTIDNLGRVLIPKDVRKQVGLETDDELGISVVNGRIILEKKTKRCMICLNEQSLVAVNENLYICTKCKENIQQIVDE